MANRIVIGTRPVGGPGIRISKPGFNVLNTGLLPSQMAFDSDWNYSAKIYLQGVAHLAGGQGVTPIQELTVNFGETLSEVPFVITTSHQIFYSSPSWNIILDQWQCIADFGKSSGWPTESPDFTLYRSYEAYTDRVVFFKLPGFFETLDQKTFYTIIARE